MTRKIDEEQLSKNLDELVELRLLKQRGDRYTLTKKGETMLDAVESLTELYLFEEMQKIKKPLTEDKMKKLFEKCQLRAFLEYFKHKKIYKGGKN